MNCALDRLATWWLKRRGVTVLPRPFIGMALGYATAQRLAVDGVYAHWQVTVPKGFPPIVLNNSIVMTGSDRP